MVVIDAYQLEPWIETCLTTMSGYQFRYLFISPTSLFVSVHTQQWHNKIDLLYNNMYGLIKLMLYFYPT